MTTGLSDLRFPAPDAPGESGFTIVAVATLALGVGASSARRAGRLDPLMAPREE